MNYQPFFDANLLISDALMLQIKALTPAFALLALLTFYALFFLHMVIYSLYKMMRAPKRTYPAHKIEVASNV